MLQDILAAIGRHDATEALRLARSLVTVDPDNAEAQHALGLALQLSGEHAEAATAFDRAIALAPHTARFHVARAAVALGQRDPERAKQELDAAVGADPNQLNAYILAAHLAIARSDAAEAERQLTLAKRINDEHPVVIALEGNLAQLRGDKERAVKLLSVAAQAMPDEPLILASLGLAYLESGHYAFAEQSLRRALEQQPGALRLRWALIEAKRRQGHAAELPAELEHVLRVEPQNARALALLGDCLLHEGKLEPALDAYRRLISLRPLPQAALDGVLRALAVRGLGDRAEALLDEQLVTDPASDDLWRRRIALVEHDVESSRLQLERWAAAMPESLAQLALRAEFDEASGELAAAEANADRVLAQQPGHAGAAKIKLRALLRRDPEAALAMADRFVAESPTDFGKRFGTVWRGFALDRLNRCDEAAECWKRSAELAEGQRAFPTIRALPAEGAPDDGGSAPRLLWGPPGSRVLEVVGLLRRLPGLPLLDDRWGNAPRDDGLWPPRADGLTAGLADWRRILEGFGIAPSEAIDWLPHWEGRIEGALSGNRLAAVIADPRDLLMNTLVFGGPQTWSAPQRKELTDWFVAAMTVLAERVEKAPERTLLIRAEALVETPELVAADLQAFFDLPSVPPSEGLEAARVGTGGVPTCFPPGRWRDYAGSFTEEFARLAPLAARLGFV